MSRLFSVIAFAAWSAGLASVVLGGLITVHLGWRWMFLVTVPVGADLPHRPVGGELEPLCVVERVREPLPPQLVPVPVVADDEVARPWTSRSTVELV